MSAHGLPRQRMLRRPGLAENPQQAQQDLQFEQYPRQISATAETGDPTRSFQMLFQYEEAARYRSQELRDQAERQRLRREASRVRKESGRRARRTLAGLFLS
ncbi:hypothetical protein Caci_7794 [Catenulispora acidiphila DSM 44928]|uniref:Uncharacterized protein n=1 Tax=Catenulispora acidiphila (strain DSM 44928 / JCM 14897 / NBRC 102108 / NRRL B-24433 / ID139908) TaxID=479433 RepID=C7QE30_CATAD|nr:hypothetical protein [Catenulispora acidiphila]ACU76618.1 hypothetical protein Caci_7794 [Catenulispora acidiphila DSM 44928]